MPVFGPHPGEPDPGQSMIDWIRSRAAGRTGAGTRGALEAVQLLEHAERSTCGQRIKDRTGL